MMEFSIGNEEEKKKRKSVGFWIDDRSALKVVGGRVMAGAGEEGFS